MKQVRNILVLMILTGCSTTRVVPFLAPNCQPTKPIAAQYCTQGYLDETGLNIKKMKECIGLWEAAAKTHNEL